ncbi:MAG: hypothetical protein OEW19_11070 [Acidobacteriota bacterium]|nr:hypothetical protein [Acidobacteriota bacterium]
MRRLLTLLLVLAASVVGSAQAPADGAWTFTLTSPMGTIDATVEMKVEGKTLTGKFDLGGGREWPIENGTVDGDVITFTLDRDGRMTYEMKGTVDGDTVAGVAAAMGATVDWTMARAK